MVLDGLISLGEDVATTISD